MEKKELLPYKPGVILQGVYKSYGRFGFLLTDDDHEDVYIAEKDHLNAVNNDTVEVKTMKSETGRHNTEGRITRVIERADDMFVCTYEMLADGGEAVPIDEKVDMVIQIPEGDEMGAVTGARVMVQVTRWPGEWTDAEGKVTEVIGYKGDKGLDIDVIIAQHRLPHVFSDDLMKEADNLPRTIVPEEGVADYRNMPIVTIDGPDSKDLDDAVYCEKKENGHFALGVHIADVSRYVTKGSLLDDEAYRRGTSVYLADRVIPMLPFQLSNDLCSLNHDEDRYAMSCLMDVAPDGTVKTEKITPSIVRVARRCNYPEINKAFDEGIAPEDLKIHLPMLEDLRECAAALRQNRTRRGALDFDFPEYKVVLDEDGKPLRIEKRIRGESEKMIEDAMIAANEAGVDKIYKVGGAQAIGALAYGTESINKVDKIVGPGNIFVALAKKAVFGFVSIDSIAGPSEILVLADETANPKYVAADLLSQAEHDELASAILVTTSEDLANEVSNWIDKFVNELSRTDIMKKSLENYGYILVADSMKDAIDATNEIASEHLEILTKNPFDTMTRIKNAGAIFLGEYSSEPLGDYFAGPNHVLPTNGTAKFFSPLSVDDFIKKSSIISFSREALQPMSEDIQKFAKAEGLTAHANSIKVRFED